jgi:quercetin dioxygenase-like cupin family protein
MNHSITSFPDAESPFKEMVKGAKVRFVHAVQMTMAEWYFEARTHLPRHSHPHEQITKIIFGHFKLYWTGGVLSLKEGDSAVIPPDLEHWGESVTECHVIDVFYPVREDYR